jgi:hypothetical protein
MRFRAMSLYVQNAGDFGRTGDHPPTGLCSILLFRNTAPWLATVRGQHAANPPLSRSRHRLPTADRFKPLSSFMDKGIDACFTLEFGIRASGVISTIKTATA